MGQTEANLCEPPPDLTAMTNTGRAGKRAYEMAGITEPRKQIHIAEPYDPFDYKELHHMEGLMLCVDGSLVILSSTPFLTPSPEMRAK